MVRFTRLSIDVTEALLEGGIVDVTARVKRFVTKAFQVRRRRHFAAAWTAEGVLDAEGGIDHRGADLRLFLGHGSANIGDRIVMDASVDPEEGFDQERAHDVDEGYATLLDGSAVFVLHALERADPLTRERLAGLHPPRDVPDVEDPKDRQEWAHLRDEIVSILVEQEARGPASIQALSQHLAEQGIDLAMLNGAEEQVPASELLTDVLEARRSPKRRRGRPTRPSAEEFTGPAVLFARQYEPTVDGRTLLKVLEQARETFGPTTAAPDTDSVTLLLREISRGGRPPAGRLPR